MLKKKHLNFRYYETIILNDGKHLGCICSIQVYAQSCTFMTHVMVLDLTYSYL